MNEKNINDVKKEIRNIEKIEEIKGSHLRIGLSSLLGLIPGAGSFINDEISKAINEFQLKKRNELLDVILSGNYEITSNLVKDEEFIINFCKTCEAVNRLATNDKVKYFGNLIRNSYLTDEKIENDEFEEYIHILEDISYREINYLVFLKENEDKMKKEKKILKWHEFVKAFNEKFNIPRANIYNIFYRLKRTGFVDENLGVSGSISGDSDFGYELDSADIDYKGFYLTELFQNFYEKII